MTVSIQTPFNTYTAAPGATLFAYQFKVLRDGDLLVSVDGVTKTLGIDYSISGIGDDEGGDVALVSPMVGGEKVLLRSNVVFDRSTDYQQNGEFPADIVNKDFDRPWLALQQMEQSIKSSIKLPFDTTGDQTLEMSAAQRANTLIGFDADGNLTTSTTDAQNVIAAQAAADAAEAFAASVDPDNIVHIAGGETITGVKSFSASPQVPTPPPADSSASSASTEFVQQNTRQKLQSISASVASNALTVSLNPNVMDFRSPSLTSGVPNTRSIAAALSLVIPSGATLGTVSGQPARLVLVAIDNAGSVEPAIINLAGGVNLDETGLISTIAIGAGSTAANVFYSATARSNVPYRVRGFVDIAQAVAGVWATAPTLVQGAGGQALSSLSGLGFGQTQQNVAASRSLGTTYYNTTGKPIEVIATFQTTASITFFVNGVAKAQVANGSGTLVQIGGIVPPGASYQITTNAGGAPNTWAELR